MELICLLFPIANKWNRDRRVPQYKKRRFRNLRAEKNSNTDRLACVIQMWFDKKTTPVKWSTTTTAVELPPVYEPSLVESILQKCLPDKHN